MRTPQSTTTARHWSWDRWTVEFWFDDAFFLGNQCVCQCMWTMLQTHMEKNQHATLAVISASQYNEETKNGMQTFSFEPTLSCFPSCLQSKKLTQIYIRVINPVCQDSILHVQDFWYFDMCDDDSRKVLELDQGKFAGQPPRIMFSNQVFR